MTGSGNAALLRTQLTHVIAELNKAQQRSADGAAADLAATLTRLGPVIERLEYCLSLLDAPLAQADPLDAARALFDAVYDADLPIEQALALGNGYVALAEVEVMRAYVEVMKRQGSEGSPPAHSDS